MFVLFHCAPKSCRVPPLLLPNPQLINRYFFECEFLKGCFWATYIASLAGILLRETEIGMSMFRKISLP